MTPIQIAYFKHFLFDKGIQRIYLSMYKYHRLQGDEKGDKSANPVSVEQFFRETHASKVIMKAFYFPMNSDYGYDYWDNLNTQWKEYWNIHKNNFSNDKYVTLKGTFAILRQNWDNKEYWKVESMVDTYKRMEIEPPSVDNIETAFNVPPSPELPTAASEEVEEENADESPTPGSLLEGFTMVDTFSSVKGRRIYNNMVGISLRNGGYRMTLSIDTSNKLRKYKYEYVKLLTNKDTKEIALIFNHNSGGNVPVNTDNKRNIVINNKEIIMHIHKFYNMKKTDDQYSLKITATIQQDSNTILKLKYAE